MNREETVTLGPWEYTEDEGWKHCGRSAWVEDDGARCDNCRAVIVWDDEEGVDE